MGYPLERDVIGRMHCDWWTHRMYRAENGSLFVFFVKMPIMRGYNTILKDIDLSLERLSDDCHRVQFKRRRTA